MTTPQKASHQFRFPEIRDVRLQRFSLFAAEPDALIVADKRVLCLVGANGIGKTSLLSAIVYALTGAVPLLSAKFESMEEYVKLARAQSVPFFRGRVREDDRPHSTVQLTLRFGSVTLSVVRSLTDPDGLVSFSRSTPNGQQHVPPATSTATELNDSYRAAVVELSGFSSFDEFVFLCHFLCTFDEHRRTLLWSGRAMERVLFKAFGIDSEGAASVDVLVRKEEKADSQVRNRQWELTRLRDRVAQLSAKIAHESQSQENYDALAERHRQLSETFALVRGRLDECSSEMHDARLRTANLTLSESSIRREYATLFSESLLTFGSTSGHPLIVRSLSDQACGLCGTRSEQAVARIRAAAAESHCPLCESLLSARDDGKASMERLRQLDEALAATSAQVAEAQNALHDCSHRYHALESALASIQNELSDFEKANQAFVERIRQPVNDERAAVVLDTLRGQILAIEDQKREAAKARDSARAEIAALKRELSKQYAAVEGAFVPRFQELATHFLGLPLSVSLDTSAATGATFVVTVRGSARRSQGQLSESQRFFLDIALRLALIQHMSRLDQPGTLFLDTPEGSLDIAYEKRAGEMLAKFAKSKDCIILTANLNSSKLLLALARNCGREGMKVCRLTDWAELSEVQVAEEAVFREAYDAIDSAMEQSAS